jgi:bacillolysin
MTYGDGDGIYLGALSLDADIVAHEITHGVKEYSSNLVYAYESGALNEALSDIFGAMVDRQEGATDDDNWFIGEDIYTPDIPGDALRNMADPECIGDYDYYPTRYKGEEDSGGVHWMELRYRRVFDPRIRSLPITSVSSYFVDVVSHSCYEFRGILPVKDIVKR